MTDWKSEYQQQIADCRKRDDKISAWEADFLDSLETRLDENKYPTPKQVETLDNIWEKATSKG